MEDRLYFIETTPEGLMAQCKDFLESADLEVSNDNIVRFGQYIQSLPNDTDQFDPIEAAIFIRKSQANVAAFALIFPEKYAQIKQREAEEQAKKDNGPQQQEIQATEEALVPEAG